MGFRQAELASVMRDVASLRETVETQEVKASDVEQMSKEKAYLEDVHENVSKQKEAEDKNLWDKELEVCARDPPTIPGALFLHGAASLDWRRADREGRFAL